MVAAAADSVTDDATSKNWALDLRETGPEAVDELDDRLRPPFLRELGALVGVTDGAACPGAPPPDVEDGEDADDVDAGKACPCANLR